MKNKQTNILFIFSDQQHWQAAGFNDATFKTPGLDRFASKSTVFTRAFCTTPQCSPSRSSIMTGLYPSKTGVLGNIGQAGGDPLQSRTIGAALREAGYRTAYFGKWHLDKDPVGTAGWDEDWGVTGPEKNKDAEVTCRALDFLARNARSAQPFAIFISYNNPHDIYAFKKERDLPPKISLPLPETWHRKDLSRVPSVQRQFMTEDHGKIIAGREQAVWQKYREFYREKVQMYDGELSRVLEAVEQQGLFDNTLTMVTSDHGDMDAQHGLVLKGPFMYEHMMRIPLVISPPAAAATARTPRETDFMCVNVDLAPTIADFAGARLPGNDGVSLKPLLTGEGRAPRRAAVIGQYYSKQRWVNPIRMIRTDRYKYNLYRGHGEELYDLQNDPSELHNLAGDPACQETQARLAGELEQWMQANADPFHSQNPTTRSGAPLAARDAEPRPA